MNKSLTTLVAAVALSLAPALSASEAKPADKKSDSSCQDCAECKCESEKSAAAKDAKENKDGKKADPKTTSETKTATLTGSHLPQQVKLAGRMSMGIQPVVVYSRADLESTGASDVKTALRSLNPSIR